MSINATLKAALDPIAPVEADTYEGKGEKYITIAYNSLPDNFADDAPEHERFLITVTLFAPTGEDTVADRKAIKEALVRAGASFPELLNASGKDGQQLVFECEIVLAAGVE